MYQLVKIVLINSMFLFLISILILTAMLACQFIISPFFSSLCFTSFFQFQNLLDFDFFLSF